VPERQRQRAAQRQAPSPPGSAAEPEIFVVVENPPELIGGLEGLQQRVRYPDAARRAGIEGTAFVQFVIDEQGNVVDPVCVRDPGGGTCEEAVRVVRASTFTPGRQRGQPVKVRFSLPVKFRLR
jgi:protein TonB